MCKVFKVLFISLLLSYTCAAQMPQLIPQPVSIKTLPGHLTINPKTTIIVYTGDNGGREMGDLLAKLLSTPMGYHLQVKNKNRNLQATALPNTISVGINLNKKEVLGDEGYTLKSTKGNVAIRANTPKGLFYGLQTLLQLLPPSIEGDKKVQTAWTVPAVEITDYPRFGWRGLMRDVSRHFFTKENIKSYIDQMAKYKFNVFHWHLTDDNGWRIQINGLPQLTDIGAWRVPRAGPFLFTAQKGPEPDEMATYGGFYTQDDIREVVKYAQERFITIVPEVDVPAHSMALIASFPNLSCLGIKNPVDVGTEFTVNKDNVLCVANDSTYLILDKIFTQVAQLFPGEYIHMGGDEAYKGFWDKCPKCQKLRADEHLKDSHELQSYFVKKIEKMLQSKGKKLIGWDEILEGGLAPEATVMSWRGMKGGIEAAKQGHKVIMTPFERCYIDMYQGNRFIEPHSYGKVLLSSAYNFEPVPDSVDAKFILGGQANLWAEAVANERHAQYMTWPRAMAISEVLWSPKAPRDFDAFTKRVETHFKRLDAANVKYARSMYDANIDVVKGAGSDTTLKIQLTTELKGVSIYYSFDSTDPDLYYPKYAGTPLDIPKGTFQIRLVTYRDKKPLGRVITVKLKELDKRL